MFTTGDVYLNLYTFFYGLLWGCVMASAEGRVGWGGDSPTWKVASDQWYSSFLKIFTWGRPIHLLPVFAIITFTVSYMQPPLWNISRGLPFGLQDLGELVAYFALFAILEDFLWFLVNPHFGFYKFNKASIKWHPNWIWLLPLDYWIGLSVFLVAGLLSRGYEWVLITGLIQVGLVMVSIVVSNRFIKKK